MSCADTPSGTTLLASEGGHTPCDSQDGPTTGRSSRGHRHVSRSRLRGDDKGSRTSGTSPLFGSGTSASYDLLLSLASRLQQRLPYTTGLTICSTRWSWKATPRGRWYSQLVASARPISGSDSGSLRTVWATPTARDWRSGHASEATMSKNSRPLNEQAVTLAVWPTPIAGDAKNSYRHSPGHLKLLGAARLATWPTPNASNGSGGGQAKRFLNPDRSNELNDAVMLAIWPTPQTDNFRSRGGDRKHEMGMDQLARSIPEMGPARITADGRLLTGSSAGTTSGGQLNPAHSRWLMGFPPAWDACAPTVMRSSRKLPRK